MHVFLQSGIDNVAWQCALDVVDDTAWSEHLLVVYPGELVVGDSQDNGIELALWQLAGDGYLIFVHDGLFVGHRVEDGNVLGVLAQ